MWETILSVAEDVMSSHSSSINYDKNYISPWKILQGYLESILQVGMIYEMIGDGDEALAYLKLGKEISYTIDSPLFLVAFSLLLGKVYPQHTIIFCRRGN